MSESKKSVADTIASNYMRVKMSQSRLTFGGADAKGRKALADQNAASEKAYKVTKTVLLPPFDAEYKEHERGMDKVKKVFDHYTEFTDRSADGTKNEGERWIRTKHLLSGKYKNDLDTALDEFHQAHRAFVAMYPMRVDQIEEASRYSGAGLGVTFDRSKFPSVDGVINGFAIKISDPAPIADASIYRTMPVDQDTREAWEAMYEATQRRSLSVMSQNLALDMVKYLGNLAENVGKLAAHKAQPDGSRGRAPAIKETLVPNVREALDRCRALAVPETELGMKLLTLVEQVEDNLDPDNLDDDLIRNLPAHHAADLAKQAGSLAELIAEQDWDY